ncbi:hypothetical protein [Sphingomonas sp. Mn802worker]|uniref:hypothetical protein n=1 Tax=Sphingomonas sp. Mn802worker TaxID=629773 RepID=UPI0012EA83E4|nr:hypothetical protein [Sphingomonas sp. Mn802worker]
MQNADLCRVQRVIVSQPFCVLEFDSDAVFEPFTLARWTWKGRAASKIDALRTDIAYRCHAVRYDPKQTDMIRHHVDELRREVLVFNRTTVLRMIFAADRSTTWASEALCGGKSSSLDRWLRIWLPDEDASAVARDWVSLIDLAQRRIQKRRGLTNNP